jgi:hypothetical protein
MCFNYCVYAIQHTSIYEAKKAAWSYRHQNAHAYLMYLDASDTLSDLRNAMLAADTGALVVGGSDDAVEGDWRWLDGPLAGTTFYDPQQSILPTWCDWGRSALTRCRADVAWWLTGCRGIPVSRTTRAAAKTCCR